MALRKLKKHFFPFYISVKYNQLYLAFSWVTNEKSSRLFFKQIYDDKKFKKQQFIKFYYTFNVSGDEETITREFPVIIVKLCIG